MRRADREWAEQCDAILVEHGLVSSKHAYTHRYTAKNRARRLKQLMVELRMHEPWQLVTHTEHRTDGWCWHLEFVGDRDDRAEQRHSSAA